MITKYNILSGGTSKELTNNVNAAIEDGWQPQGGVVQTNAVRFIQAMVLSPSAMQVAKRRMNEAHECVYLSDGGGCTICGKTAIE